MIAFTIYGKPVPQGSTRAFIPKGWTRPIITTDNTRLKPWRQQITETALACNPLKIETGGVQVHLNFYFNRPKSAKKRRDMVVKPDVDKLIRAVLDALTGVCYRDDSQVVNVTARKHYCEDGSPFEVERVYVIVGAADYELVSLLINPERKMRLG